MQVKTKHVSSEEMAKLMGLIIGESGQQMPVTTEQAIEAWREKAITQLREWLAVSKDHRKTIETWAAVYIKCGTCARGFAAWYEDFDPGPEDDLEAWIEAAIEVITRNRWI